MAATWHLHMYMLITTMLSVGSACLLPKALRVSAPLKITAGYLVSHVKVDGCETETLQFVSSDGNFSVGREGIVAVLNTVVPLAGRTFSVRAQDASGHRSDMEVTLVQERLVHGARSKRSLKRAKREWKPPPFNIMENGLPPFPKSLDHIGSNSAQNHTVYYTASGPGVTLDPIGLLSVDREGLLKIHRSIDREQYPQIEFTARVWDINTNKETDAPLTVTVIVDDMNDNKPQFKGPLQLSVLEQSKIGALVGKVNATDSDQANTLHTKIRYTLLTGQSFFTINPETGLLVVQSDKLDREAQDKHLVTVQIKDMDGANTGLSNTATATITLGDINDNAPTFKLPTYKASVDENTKEKLILRIPVEDRDLKGTPNWEAVFKIAEGNENNNFRIDTDPQTNEGLLYVANPLDFEKTKNVKLKVVAQNKAKLVGTKGTWLSIPIDIGVNDIDEGPEFGAPNIRLPVKENAANGTLIGSYTARDPETATSRGIKYYKLTDPSGWVNVDSNSGELRVANTIDRESPVLQDGLYNITMKAVDASGKSATGTVTLVVEDENDNVPELPKKDMVLCEKEGHLGSVMVNAHDGDQSPFAGPFIFNLPKDHDGNWEVTTYNASAATLKHTKELPLGMYNVPVMVTDLQGMGELQTVRVKICQCRKDVCVAKGTSIDLGPLGILALLLPLLLLLLLGILLALICATKHQKIEIEDVGDSGGILLKSNIEVPGEEVLDPKLMVYGMDPTAGSVKGSSMNVGWAGKSTSTMGTMDNRQMQGFAQNSFSQGNYGPGMYGTGQFGKYEETNYIGNNMATNSGQFYSDEVGQNQAWLDKALYFDQKLGYMYSEHDQDYAEDILHPYGFEGLGSPVGSLGSCNEFDHKEDLGFLNTLGPKFKSLADACVKQ